MLANALLVAAVLLGAAILGKVGGLLAGSREAESRGTVALGPGNGDDRDPNGPAARVAALTEQLKKKNLFVKAPPKQHPIREVAGILGREALIDGKWYKAGDRVGEATILAVEPTKIRVAWDGTKKDFAPISASLSKGPSGPRTISRPPSRPSGPSRVVTVRPVGPHRRESGPGLSPQERENLRDRWQTMTPEERERLKEQLRQRYRGRPR